MNTVELLFIITVIVIGLIFWWFDSKKQPKTDKRKSWHDTLREHAGNIHFAAKQGDKTAIDLKYELKMLMIRINDSDFDFLDLEIWAHKVRMWDITREKQK